MAGTFSIVVMTIFSLFYVAVFLTIILVGFVMKPKCSGPKCPGRSYCCSKCYPERPGQYECVQPVKADGTRDTENEMVCSKATGLCEPKNNPGQCGTANWMSSCPKGTTGF